MSPEFPAEATMAIVANIIVHSGWATFANVTFGVLQSEDDDGYRRKQR